MQNIAKKNSQLILIVDDEPSMRLAVSASLDALGFRIISAANAEEALQILESHTTRDPIDLVLTDLKMPGMSGIELFHQAKATWPLIPIIMMSAFGTVPEAVEAMKAGLLDYLVKPFSEEALSAAVSKGLSVYGKEAVPERRGRMTRSDRPIITEDPEMLKMLKMARVVAASQATVMIEAESGTGKELLARFIHDSSPRAHQAFVAINCAAVPEALLESELFGFEKGAFTGAFEKKAGRFELAQNGTLLLDEVGEMQLSLQAKLLRVLQEREVDVLGSKAPLPIDIRVIATTNRPLLAAVKDGHFREDLYYRLNVFPLRIPPLRERLADIPALADHFIRETAKINQTKLTSISEEALSELKEMSWRGNVREFENVMARALLLAGGDEIEPEHLLFAETMHEAPHHTTASPLHKTATTVRETERQLILDTLAQVSGNRTHAARILDISIRTLRNKLREYHKLDPDCENTETLQSEL